MEEQIWILSKGSARPGPPSYSYDLCGDVESIVGPQRSCVLSMLLYGSECWRMTVADLKKLQTFHTNCLRKIARIFWPRKISNADLLKLTRQEDISITLVRQRWQTSGSVTSFEAKLMVLPESPFIGHLRASESVVDPKLPGDELWSRN